MAEISIDHRRLIIERFLSDLESFFKVLEKTDIRLYSSSLLFVYEGDSDALTEALKKEQDELKESKIDNTNLDDDDDDDDDDEDEDDDEDDEDIFKITDLKMIDFAHSFFRKGVGKDERALFGLKNTIDYLKQLLNEKKYH